MGFSLMRECRGGSGGRGGSAQARRSSAASARASATAPFSAGAWAARAPSGPKGPSSAASRREAPPSPKPCPGRSGCSAAGPCSSSCCRRDLQSAQTALDSCTSVLWKLTSLDASLLASASFATARQQTGAQQRPLHSETPSLLFPCSQLFGQRRACGGCAPPRHMRLARPAATRPARPAPAGAP